MNAINLELSVPCLSCLNMAANPFDLLAQLSWLSVTELGLGTVGQETTFPIPSSPQSRQGKAISVKLGHYSFTTQETQQFCFPLLC